MVKLVISRSDLQDGATLEIKVEGFSDSIIIRENPNGHHDLETLDRIVYSDPDAEGTEFQLGETFDLMVVDKDNCPAEKYIFVLNP